MRMNLVDRLEFERGLVAGPQQQDEIKEMVMAKVIEFYVPTRFQRPLKEGSEVQSAKAIEFCSQKGIRPIITENRAQR